MATAQGQDVIRCHLCPNPVEHHCNLCRVDLCPSCIAKHMADKSKKHEVVEYTSRKEHAAVLPTCPTHTKNRCETYCHDCKIPICIQCLMSLHKKHEFADINEVLQKHKQQIIADTKELENTIVPKYKKAIPATTTSEFDKVLSAIEEQESKICKAVHEAGIQLKDKITKQKEEAVRKSKESQSLIDKAEKELNQIIQNNKGILRGHDAVAIINYQSRNGDFRKGPELPRLSCPVLLVGFINQDQLIKMLGFLQIGNDPKRQSGMLKMMDDPKVLSTIQSPYGGSCHLWRVQCVGRDKILTSGNLGIIKEIDRTGSILKTIYTDDDVLALTINLQQEPVFSSCNLYENTKIYMYKDNVKLLFHIPDWFPVGLSYTVNGDLLVSMRSMDMTQSRVVRYSGKTEIRKIQYDSQGQLLFSTGVSNVLPLTENGNGDICVADNFGKAVVVVDSSGGLRFKYQGNLSKQSKYTEFAPLNIATDVNTQILICDRENNNVHIIDCDGNFVRYLEHPCRGGLSIDTDHNLVIGDKNTGKIKIIKYLE